MFRVFLLKKFQKGHLNLTALKPSDFSPGALIVLPLWKAKRKINKISSGDEEIRKQFRWVWTETFKLWLKKVNVFNSWYIERQICLQYISEFLEIQRTWYLHEVWFLVVFGFNRSIISFLNNEPWHPFGKSNYSWFTSSYSQTFLSLVFYLNVEFLVYWNQPIGDEYKKVFLSNFSIF